jgi:hypothetical protein
VADTPDLPPKAFEDVSEWIKKEEHQDTLKALGIMTVEFSLLHAALERLLEAVMGLAPNVLPLVFENVTVGTLIRYIKKVAKPAYKKKQRGQLKPLLEEAEDLLTRRNKAVHAFWYMHATGPSLVFHKNGKPGLPSPGDLTAINKDLSALVHHLSNFTNTHHMPALPKTESATKTKAG